jgi:hypothetical protein
MLYGGQGGCRIAPAVCPGGFSMGSLIFGLLLVLAAILMLRIAKPQPNGSPVRFLALDSLATVYALFVTAFVCVGVGMTINGTAKLIAVASAYVD